tara:strand:- start:357 stop:539 length:183 start_codon:yes stop_codon:yes gene_type:complete
MDLILQLSEATKDGITHQTLSELRFTLKSCPIEKKDREIVDALEVIITYLERLENDETRH